MTTIHEALDHHLTRAVAMHDTVATRVLQDLRAELDDTPGLDGANPDDARRDEPHGTEPHDTDAHDADVLRRAIDTRAAMAARLTDQPDAAATLRHEAEILTIVLATAGR